MKIKLIRFKSFQFWLTEIVFTINSITLSVFYQNRVQFRLIFISNFVLTSCMFDCMDNIRSNNLYVETLQQYIFNVNLWPNYSQHRFLYLTEKLKSTHVISVCFVGHVWFNVWHVCRNLVRKFDQIKFHTNMIVTSFLKIINASINDVDYCIVCLFIVPANDLLFSKYPQMPREKSI